MAVSRLLYIGIRCDCPPHVPACNERRLYSDERAAWRWLDSKSRDADDSSVYEVDLDEVVRMSRQPEPTWQARYEHAIRRAEKWLELREKLEPIVRDPQLGKIAPVPEVPQQDFEMHEWPPGQPFASCGVLLVHRRTGIAVIETGEKRGIDNLAKAGRRLKSMLVELGYGDGSSGRQESFLEGR